MIACIRRIKAHSFYIVGAFVHSGIIWLGIKYESPLFYHSSAPAEKFNKIVTLKSGEEVHPKMVLTRCPFFLSVHRALKVVMTPST